MDFSGVGFFGDSWVAGAEANEIDSTDSPEYAFPTYFENSKNLSISGASNDIMLHVLLENLDRINTAVFCLTDPSRRYFVDDDNIEIDGENSRDWFTQQKKYEMLYRTLLSLSNDLNDDLIVSKTCLLMYYMCRMHNISCYFLNLFSGQYGVSPFWKMIPDELWLTPLRSNIVKEVFDTQGWYPEYPNVGDFNYWLQDNNSDVQKYIKPCKYHPNKTGQRAIADFIKSKLK